MKYLIIYHREDNDGLFSAAIINEYISRRSNGKDEVEFYGATYDEVTKFDDNSFDYWNRTFDTVIMTDISIPNPEMMQKLVKRLGIKFIWIDHHAPAIQSSYDYGYDYCNGERDTTRSAILLAYRLFFDNDNSLYNASATPYIFNILSAWDSFTFEQEHVTKEFAYDVNMGINAIFKLSIDDICQFVHEVMTYGEETNDIPRFLKTGHIINQYNAWNDANMIKTYGDDMWTVDGRNAVMVYKQGPTSSLMFDSVDKNIIKNGIVFKPLPDGRVVISLYNTNNDDTFHCGEYLKRVYGGGGHSGAAGAVLSYAEYIRMLETRAM